MKPTSLVAIISLFLAQTSLVWTGMYRGDEISQQPDTTKRHQSFLGQNQTKETLYAAEPADVKIPDGTAVHVVLQKSISSEDAKKGDVFELVVAEPVKINGVEVIATRSVARVTIIKAQKTSSNGKPGELVIAMQDVVATDGTRIPLRLLKKALPRLGLEATDIGERILIGIAAPFAVFYYLPTADFESPPQGRKTKQPGKPAVMSAGENFLVFVNGETAVKAVSPVQQ